MGGVPHGDGGSSRLASSSEAASLVVGFRQSVQQADAGPGVPRSVAAACRRGAAAVRGIAAESGQLDGVGTLTNCGAAGRGRGRGTNESPASRRFWRPSYRAPAQGAALCGQGFRRGQLRELGAGWPWAPGDRFALAGPTDDRQATSVAACIRGERRSCWNPASTLVTDTARPANGRARFAASAAHGSPSPGSPSTGLKPSR